MIARENSSKNFFAIQYTNTHAQVHLKIGIVFNTNVSDDRRNKMIEAENTYGFPAEEVIHPSLDTHDQYWSSSHFRGEIYVDVFT